MEKVFNRLPERLKLSPYSCDRLDPTCLYASLKVRTKFTYSNKSSLHNTVSALSFKSFDMIRLMISAS